ncbi:helix-turn-helix transcriptional regulator [Nostoc sp. T09]|uniref:helix-turn-helix transcriptional regulator n=1 Tax=Nostoc sp. T09 TaxID=1932621 RepID=UPI000A3AD0C5|nr:helix-turn-helix transcriptional regulator [Nostoc sp. T09]OUL33214.1 helix-turn-helix transcriptional regulator [Nostoc sp. T09]
MLFPDDEKNLDAATAKTAKDDGLQPVPKIDLLQAIIESFVDGIFIVTTEGKLIYTNEFARSISRELMPKEAASNTVPEEIWRVCQSLIESRELFPDEKIIIEFEIAPKPTVKLRLRARWLELCASKHNFLLVTVEDCNLYSKSIAIADAKKYNLTDREIEVWQLRRANLTYREIANHLYITINTVKKHLKNIHAKQQEKNNMNEYKIA